MDPTQQNPAPKPDPTFLSYDTAPNNITPTVIQPTNSSAEVPGPDVIEPAAAAPILNYQPAQNSPTVPETAQSFAPTQSVPPPQYPVNPELPSSMTTPSQPFSPNLQNTMSNGVSPVTPPGQPLPPLNFAAGGGTPYQGLATRKSGKKKLFLGGGIVALFLLISSGIVFGYYIPNQPANVYKTGITRSGLALTKLVNTATTQNQLEAFKKSDITLSIDAKYNDTSYSGSFDAKFDGTKADGSVNFVSKTPNTPDQTFNAKFLGELPAGSQYPNIYVQLNGIKDLGLDNYLPGLAAYDGKWISFLSDYLKSLGSIPTAEQTSKKQLTSADIAELANAVTSVSSDYVFSTQPGKAVFEMKSFVGKEKTDNINTYHYTVSLNKENVVAYCKAVVEKVYSTNAYKKLPWVDENNISQDKVAALKDCDTSADGVKPDKTYDLWVDAKYKLIYKIRITDDTGAEMYTDIGQVYNGGDDVSFFVNYHDGTNKSDGKFTLDTNIKTATTKAILNYTSEETDNKYNVNITLDAKPYTGEINTNAPAGAIPIQDVLKQLGISPSDFFGTDNTTTDSNGVTPAATGAKDTERQTDIKALASHLEVYNAENGMYPTLANLNNSTWVAVNLKGLDKEALRDPDGTLYTFLTSSTAKQYGYAPTKDDGSACNNTTGNECTKFKLTYTQEDGVQKSILNL